MTSAQFVVATFVVAALIVGWLADRDFQRMVRSMNKENEDD